MGPTVGVYGGGGVELNQLTEGKTLVSMLVLVLPQLCRFQMGAHGKKR